MESILIIISAHKWFAQQFNPQKRHREPLTRLINCNQPNWGNCNILGNVLDPFPRLSINAIRLCGFDNLIMKMFPWLRHLHNFSTQNVMNSINQFMENAASAVSSKRRLTSSVSDYLCIASSVCSSQNAKRITHARMKIFISPRKTFRDLIFKRRHKYEFRD